MEVKKLAPTTVVEVELAGIILPEETVEPITVLAEIV
jgi:hypothetical protein